jgi:hypothetical protein
MPHTELAALVSAKLREARELTVLLGADVLLFFIDIAILDADHVQRELTDSQRQPCPFPGRPPASVRSGS